jgi:transcriptional regulator with XRE-family HTH domain
MKHRLPSYLHTLRKRWGLSQPELAALLDVTASALSRFEKRSRRPTAELIVAIEVIFGHSAKDVFPAFYQCVEHEVISPV